jgi:hypothetical protein
MAVVSIDPAAVRCDEAVSRRSQPRRCGAATVATDAHSGVADVGSAFVEFGTGVSPVECGSGDIVGNRS